jgi:hypothetical protein
VQVTEKVVRFGDHLSAQQDPNAAFKLATYLKWAKQNTASNAGDALTYAGVCWRMLTNAGVC